MRDDLNWIARYLTGACSREEAEEAQRKIAADPELQRLVDEQLPAWKAEADSADRSDWNTSAAWRRLDVRLVARERKRGHLGIVGAMRRPAAHPFGRRWRVAAIAATVILALAGGTLWQRRSDRDGGVTASVALREIRTVAGQRAVLSLSDGSQVVLGPGSVLRYDSTRFGTSTRTVELDGEGYFTVAHKPKDAPVFVVQTARGAVRDIGTAFNVRSFTSQPSRMEVVVTDGEVLLGDRALDKGDLARVEANGGLTVRRVADVNRYVAWTSGRLVFDDVPLAEAIPDLERWYDLDITLADSSIAHRRLVATLREGASDAALKLVASALNLRVEIRGRVVTLYPKN